MGTRKGDFAARVQKKKGIRIGNETACDIESMGFKNDIKEKTREE